MEEIMNKVRNFIIWDVRTGNEASLMFAQKQSSEPLANVGITGFIVLSPICSEILAYLVQVLGGNGIA